MVTLRFLRLTMLIALLSVMLTACSTDQQPKTEQTTPKKHLTLLLNFSSQSLDPHQDYTPLRAGVAETLVKLGEDLKVQPWLATEWKSDDGQRWTFMIRDGVTFHDGRKLDAEAVMQSLQRAMDTNPGVKKVLKIQSMEAKGQTLTILTENKFPQFPSELVHPNSAIINVSAPDLDKKPIGTGPFQVSAFTSGSALELVRYDRYWDGQAKLDSATFAFNEDANARLSALKAGDADVVYRPPVESVEQIKQDPNLKLDSVVGLKTHELAFNTNHHDFQNAKVRKAFDVLVNRKELKDDIMGGQATIAKGPFLPDFPFVPAYEEKPSGIDAARKLFQEAGYQIENGNVTDKGKPLTFKLVTYSSRAEFPLLAQVLQAQAKELGITIDISIEMVDTFEEFLLTNDSWDLATYSPIIAPRGDASYFLNVSFVPGGSLNFSKIDDKKMSQLVNELDQAVETTKRNELTQQALRYIEDQTYYSYLVHPNTLVAYRNTVKNWVTGKSDYYMLTHQLDME